MKTPRILDGISGELIIRFFIRVVGEILGLFLAILSRKKILIEVAEGLLGFLEEFEKQFLKENLAKICWGTPTEEFLKEILRKSSDEFIETLSCFDESFQIRYEALHEMDRLRPFSFKVYSGQSSPGKDP